jgi:hypothetical protein
VRTVTGTRSEFSLPWAGPAGNSGAVPFNLSGVVDDSGQIVNDAIAHMDGGVIVLEELGIYLVTFHACVMLEFTDLSGDPQPPFEVYGAIIEDDAGGGGIDV